MEDAYHRPQEPSLIGQDGPEAPRRPRRKRFPQIHHVPQATALLDDGMVVIIREEVTHHVRPFEAAFAVERKRAGRVARPNPKRASPAAVPPRKKRQQRPAVPLSLPFRRHRQVLDLIDAPAFVRHHGDCHGLALLPQREHLPASQITLHHVPLFVPKQEQGAKTGAVVRRKRFDIHGPSPPRLDNLPIHHGSPFVGWIITQGHPPILPPKPRPPAFFVSAADLGRVGGRAALRRGSSAWGCLGAAACGRCVAGWLVVS